MKEWTFSFDKVEANQTLMSTAINGATGKVLGAAWNPMRDELLFKVKLDFTVKKGKQSKQIAPPISNTLIKRIILSQTNSIYDLSHGSCHSQSENLDETIMDR